MKKSLFATMAAAAVAALCVPVFSGCSAKVGYVLKDDGNGNCYYSVTAEGFTSFMKGEVIIPETYGGYPVKEIEAEAFFSTSITKVTIPASIEKIGTAAFAYNNNLEEVVFAEGIALEEISWGSFAECVNLKSITLPPSVKTVDGRAFYECRSLAEVNLPEGLQRINASAFSECKSLVGVNLPQGLISLGTAAFYNCTALESIVLPDGMQDAEVPALGPIAFFGCSSLKTAVLGEGITAVSAGLFGSCEALETLYLPSTLKSIKGAYTAGKTVYGHAFYNAKALSTVYFAGTEAEWAAVEIDDTVYEDISDNSAIYRATVICNTAFA